MGGLLGEMTRPADQVIQQSWHHRRRRGCLSILLEEPMLRLVAHALVETVRA